MSSLDEVLATHIGARRPVLEHLECDPAAPAPVTRSHGCVLRRDTPAGVGIEQILRDRALADPGMPGLAPRP